MSKTAGAASPDVRACAADALVRVLDRGEYTSAVLADFHAAHPDCPARDRALYAVLVEGTLEQLLRIDYLLNAVSDTPVRKMKPFIRALLRISAYQILFLDRIPDHAAVSEAVRIAGHRGFGRLKGFVNGVLRSLIRQKDQIPLPDRIKAPETCLSVSYSCPEWIVRTFAARFGMEETERILQAFRSKKELCLWTNPVRTTAEKLAARLAEEGVSARPHPYLSDVLLCGTFERIEDHPSFRDGDFYIQDPASILAVLPALSVLRRQAEAAPAETLRVIDVCAAPGGKSLYLAAHLPQARISCRDRTPQKTEKIGQNIRRLHLTHMEIMVQDAARLRDEDLQTADLVIADLPCSGLGTIGRKPDLKYRLKESDPGELAALQYRILRTAAQYIKPGGYLLYSTCTISREENEDQAARISRELLLDPVPLEGLPEEITAGSETPAEGYLQLLPEEAPYHDGFFISLFQKKTTDTT